MKNSIIAVLLLFSISLTAQEWQIDMDLAQKQAKQEHKKIILVFQGSDWCAPCMKLDKEIWNSEVFQKYAKDHFVMLQADFPRKKKNKLAKEQKKKNGRLFEQYNKQGIFPFVVVLDSNKKVLKTAGYKKMTPAKYIEYLNNY